MKELLKNFFKIIVFVIISFFIYCNEVNAKDVNISVDGIRVIEKSSGVDANITKQNDKYNFDFTFHHVDDYVVYQISLRNDSDLTYYFKTIKHETSSDNLVYQYDQINGQEFKKGSIKNILIKVVYKNKVDDIDKRVQDDNLSFIFNLVDEKGNSFDYIINPNTNNVFFISLFVIIIGLIIVSLLFIKRKKILYSLISVFILMFPVVVLAEKYDYLIKLNCSYKLYDQISYNIFVNDDSDNETSLVSYGSTIGDLEEPSKKGNTFDGWYSDSNFQTRYTSNTVITENMSIYAKWKPKTYTCPAGEYLPKGEIECQACTAGSYCVGGDYKFSSTEDRGIIECVEGSYSVDNASTCTACEPGKTTDGSGKAECSKKCFNVNGSETWNTPSWNNNNTVNNLCSISTCQNIATGVYNLNNNICTVTSTIYSYYYPFSNSFDLINCSYGNSYFLNKADMLNNIEYGRPRFGKVKYMYIKSNVVNNIINKRELCFSIMSSMYISGANNGEYCLEAKSDGYQSNVAVLKRAFGNNHPNCTETEQSYICKKTSNYSNNHDYSYIAYKNGDVSAFYDQSEQWSNANCGLKIPVDGPVKENSGGCLDGETIIEVYDKKKKKRRRKKLKDVTPDDLILCWDFDKGEFAFVEPLWIKKVETMNKYYLLEFSDGSYLKVIGDHKVFDVDKARFVNAGADNELEIGSHVYNSKGEIVELVSLKVIEEEIDSYNVITNYHMNLFANGILTSCKFSNIYDIKDMKYVKDSKERISNDDLDEIDSKYIDGLRLNEVPIDFKGNKKSTIMYIKKYIENLISKEK